MAKTIYTDEQLSAIRTRDKSLLVSAAAGAGKTATLTERIICSLIGIDTPYDRIDPNDPPRHREDINKMLIVTFTNDAVNELRARISAALKNAVAECHTGPYIDKISVDLESNLLSLLSESGDALEDKLSRLLAACPSAAIKKDIIAEALELRLSYSGEELAKRIADVIRAAGDDCRSRRPECIIESLEHQLYLLPSARISTIDSFCNDILKSNAERCGLPPRYRIADPIEAKVLEHSVWTERIDAALEGLIPEVATPEEFEELTTALTGVKTNSNLEELFKQLYEKSKSTKRGVKIFTDIREKLESFITKPLEEVSYVEYAMQSAREMADYYLRIINDKMAEVNLSSLGIDYAIADIKARMEAEADVKKNYKGKKKDAMLATLDLPCYSEKFLVIMDKDRELFQRISSAATYAEMKAALSTPFASLSDAGRGEKTPETVAYQEFRDSYLKTAVPACYKDYFVYTEEDWREHIKELAALNGVIERFIQHFDEVFFKEKMKRAAFEYSDITRKCYEMLLDENDAPTELALALREQYTSVYIDEYQDVNALQDMIFLAVSKPNNRFTVGDIKQSIYGFRSARPDLFAKMKETYPKLENSEGSPSASIFMSKNFRCDETIINFVNEIFDEMFGLTAESIGYTPEDRLVFAKKYDPKKNEKPCKAPPEVMLFSRAAILNEVIDGERDGEDTETSMMPPLWVRDKIKELLEHGRLNNGKRVTQKDIAIILRKDRGRVAAYRDAIKDTKYTVDDGTVRVTDKIRVSAPDNESFFFNSEIRLALCLLNAINNPMRDIYLAGVMLSPLYGFTPSELVAARRIKRSSLWHSVRAYASAHPESRKWTYFIDSLTKYRRISEGLRVDALLLRLYNETGLLALGLGSGCKENLMLLYNYARQFEASSYEGLYSFINYVNTVISGGETFRSKKEEGESDAVTIITAHRSKGLEYPIVILADAATPLISKNERDAHISYSEDTGIAFNTRLKGGLSLVDSPAHRATKKKNIEKSIEEELRVYYVALTRARERLYMVGTPNAQTSEKYIEEANMRKKYRSHYLLRQVKSFVDILYSLDTSAQITWQAEEGEHTDESNGAVTSKDDNTVCAAEKVAEYSAASDEERLTEGAARADLTDGLPEGLTADASANGLADAGVETAEKNTVYAPLSDGASLTDGTTRADLTDGLPEGSTADASANGLAEAGVETAEKSTAYAPLSDGASLTEGTARADLTDGLPEGSTADASANGLADADGAKCDTERQESSSSDDVSGDERAENADTYTDLSDILSERFNYRYPDAHLTVLPEKMSISRLSPNVLDGTEESDTDDGDSLSEKAKIDRPAENGARKRRLGKCPDFYTGKKSDESAKRGIATHNVLQFMNTERLMQDGAEAEIDRLINDGFISLKDSERVYKEEIERFRGSTLFAEMLKAERGGRRLYREFRFSVMLPASLFATKPEVKERYRHEKMLLQGVIDCIYEDESGELHLVDYKTDRLTEKELNDKSLAEGKLSDAHWLQLTYYAIAIRKMLGKFPKTVRVYSLPLGDTVDVRLGDEIEEFKKHCSD